MSRNTLRDIVQEKSHEFWMDQYEKSRTLTRMRNEDV